MIITDKLDSNFVRKCKRGWNKQQKVPGIAGSLSHVDWYSGKNASNFNIVNSTKAPLANSFFKFYPQICVVSIYKKGIP